MGRNEKIIAGSLSLIAALSLLWSLTGVYYTHTVLAPTFGGVYTEGMVGQPVYINPLLAHSETDLSLTRLIFSGLYKYNSRGQVIPDLADGMPAISPDQKQYTINLKKNVVWHNGKNFNADDIIFTFQTLQNPDYKSPLRNLWLSTTMAKISDYQIQFTTKDVSGPFLDNLTQPIIPKFVWSSVQPQNFLNSQFNLGAVGSGPYAIKEIKKQSSGKIQSITLEAFSNFYLGRSQIDAVVIKFFDVEDDMLNGLHSGEISGLGFSSLTSNLYLDKDQANHQVLHIPLPQYQVAFFNLTNKILSDLAVRQALFSATDRQAIVAAVFKGNARVPTSPLLFGSLSATATPETYNLENAKKILDAAGWTVDPKTNQRSKKNVSLAITITTNDSTNDSKAAEELAGQWRKLNMQINLNVVPTKQVTDTIIKNPSFDVLLFPQKFGTDPDPYLFWHSSQIKDPGLNLSGFVDTTADQLITQARTTTDQAARVQKYQQLDQVMTQKIPGIFLDQIVYTYALDKNIKHASYPLLYETSDRFYDITNWYMKEKRVWK